MPFTEMLKSNITIIIGLVFTAGGLYYKVDGIDDREENMETRQITLEKNHLTHTDEFRLFQFEYIKEHQRLIGEIKLLQLQIEDLKKDR